MTVHRGEQPIRDTLEFSEITNFSGQMDKKKKKNLNYGTMNCRSEAT